MTAHELARKLLDGKDLPVALVNRHEEYYVYPYLWTTEKIGVYETDFGEKYGPFILVGVYA